MRVEQVREERSREWHRVVADVVWEEHELPTCSLFIASPDDCGLSPSADALLVALLPLAQWSGERRISVEGRICCRLRDGLAAAMDLFHLSYGRVPVLIEPTHGFAPTRARTEPRTASFLSGGIDALALLRANRLEYPHDHPRFVRDCILLFGLNTYDFGVDGTNPERQAAFEAHAARLAAFAERAGATLIRMATNVRTLYPDFGAWTDVGFGAGMVGVAHCLGERLDRVLLASAGLGMRLPMHGSHPWLDHHFSTEAVAVHHAQPAMTRFEKTRLVADWEDALGVLRSCLYLEIPDGDRINCGKCDKCLRTMLALAALDRLDRAPTFPHDRVTTEMVDAIRIENRLGAMFYAECADVLAERGRLELARPLRRKIARFERDERRRRLMSVVKKLARR